MDRTLLPVILTLWTLLSILWGVGNSAPQAKAGPIWDPDGLNVPAPHLQIEEGGGADPNG